MLAGRDGYTLTRATKLERVCCRASAAKGSDPPSGGGAGNGHYDTILRVSGGFASGTRVAVAPTKPVMAAGPWVPARGTIFPGFFSLNFVYGSEQIS